MANYNRVILAGNMTRDVELRYGQASNVAVARSALAVNSRYKDKEETLFVDFVVFNKPAETLKEFAKKGTPLLIEGRLVQSNWEKDGVKHSRHEIRVDNFQLLGRKGDREEGSGERERYEPREATPPPNESPSDPKNEDDDIPF